MKDFEDRLKSSQADLDEEPTSIELSLIIDGKTLVYALDDKGQLISKCPFGVIVWTKIPTKSFPGFLP